MFRGGGSAWAEWLGTRGNVGKDAGFQRGFTGRLSSVGCAGALGQVVSLFPFSSDALKDGKEIKWPDAMYPDLHMPFAPSWSLHWAYRDGHLVNLPVSLLVEGDIIALRPGQESFASLRGIKVSRDFYPSLEMQRESPQAAVGGSQSGS